MKPFAVYLCALSITTSTVIICGTLIATVPTASGASDTSQTRKDTARKVRAYLARSSSALGETMVSGRVDAWRVIATVANKQSIADRTICQSEGKTMRPNRLPGHIEAAVTSVEPTRFPYPTGFGVSFVNLRPESLFWRAEGFSIAAYRTHLGSAILGFKLLVARQTGSRKLSSSHIAPPSAFGQDSGSGLAPRRSPNHTASGYRALAKSAAHLCGITSREDVGRFLRLIARESGWRHYGRDGAVLRSSSGALGLGQIKPSTAQAFTVADIREPWGNLVTSACLLQSYYQKRGSWREAVLDYRSGPNRRRTTREAHAYADNIIGGVE